MTAMPRSRGASSRSCIESLLIFSSSGSLPCGLCHDGIFDWSKKPSNRGSGFVGFGELSCDACFATRCSFCARLRGTRLLNSDSSSSS